MKHIVILLDGAADYPIKSLGGKTPLEVALKPNIDELSKHGETGLVKMVPDGLSPGSDVANLSVMGYDPHKYYTGRSPLEAVSMGINLSDNDTTFRANIVTLSDDKEFEEKTMIDYSSGEIPTEQSAILIEAVSKEIKTDLYELFAGISYRHLLLWHDNLKSFKFTPPHDISGKKITDYLPDSTEILNIMKKSYEILKDHPLNKQRIKEGKKPANSLWIWGQGTKPTLPSFNEKFNKKSSVISAVDLIKGIGICAKMRSIDVEGTTGTIDTNFKGKAMAAIEALEQGDSFIYVHLEAPDECGHHFEVENKVKSIELIDKKIVGPIFSYLQNQNEEFSILIVPDHATPISLGTHTNDPVPYIIYRSNNLKDGVSPYCESKFKNIFSGPGYKLMNYFIENGDA